MKQTALTKITFSLILSIAGISPTQILADVLVVSGGKASVVNEEVAVKDILQEFLNQSLSSSPLIKVDRASERTLDASLVGLKTAALVTLTLKERGKIVRSQKAKISSIEELDFALPRLVQAVAENKSIIDTVSRGTALNAESRDPSRLKALGGFQVDISGFGAATQALGTQDPLFSIGFGYSWNVEPIRVHLHTDFMGQSGDGIDGNGEHKAFIWANNLSVDYYLYQTRTLGVFLGGGMGFGNFSTPRAVTSTYGNSDYKYYDDVSHWGLIGTAEAGLELLRQADINVDIRARAMTYAGKINDEVPVILGLGLGVRF